MYICSPQKYGGNINYRFTAILVSAFCALAALVSALYLVFYEFAGDIDTERTMRVTAFDKDPITGMIFFLSAVISIILGIFTIYRLFPAILNKEKIAIVKSPLIMSVINGALQLILFILTLVLLSREDPNTKIGFIICLVFNFIAFAGTTAAIYPFLKGVFYMPEIKK